MNPRDDVPVCPLCNAAVFTQAAPHLKKGRVAHLVGCVVYVLGAGFCVLLAALLGPLALVFGLILLIPAFVHFCLFLSRLRQSMPTEWKCSECQWHGLSAKRIEAYPRQLRTG
jgi:hypothetical protein